MHLQHRLESLQTNQRFGTNASIRMLEPRWVHNPTQGLSLLTIDD